MKLVTSALLLSLSMVAFAEEATMDPQQQEAMKKWEEYATPGEQQKMLQTYEGNWTYKSKSWEKPDSKKAEESTGTSSFKMVLGGRFLQQEVKGTAMGQPFEGHGMIGYDNVRERYDSTWMDSMGTGIMKGEGTYDKKSKTITDFGEFTSPTDADKTAQYRSEWKLKDKDNMTFTMYVKGMNNIEKEYKMMEMTYKRVQ